MHSQAIGYFTSKVSSWLEIFKNVKAAGADAYRFCCVIANFSTVQLLMLWPSYWKTVNWCSQKLIMLLFLFSLEVHQWKPQSGWFHQQKGERKKNKHMYINTPIASGGPFQTLDSEFTRLCNHLFLSIWGNRACQLLGEPLYFHLNDMSTHVVMFFPFSLSATTFLWKVRVKKNSLRKYFIFNCSLLSSNLQKVLQLQWHRK